MFMVSTFYRGALNITSMRGFTDKVEARKYWDKLRKEAGKWAGTSLVRAYKLTDENPPQILNTEKRWENA